MRVLLRQPPAQERRLQLERLRIGRGTEQDVQLNDLRVALAHAEIVPALKSTYELIAFGSESLLVNGAPRRGGPLWPGDVIELGRYRLSLGVPQDDAHLVLEIEEQVSQREERSRQRARHRTALEHTRLSRRAWSWLLGLGILLVCLALPLGLRYLAPQAGSADAQWSSGPVSDVHAHFGGDCQRCHAQPFERVADAACTDCHRSMAEHSREPALLSAGLGLHDGGLRCAACHREHNGAQGLINAHPEECTSCHAQAGASFASRLAALSDFSLSHPPFTPRLARYEPGKGFVHAPAVQGGSAPLREDSNLKFPHDLHLAAQGIESPQDQQVMVCADCHQPDRSGRTFETVRMTAHCASCHKLDFDPAQPGRELPHGQPAEVARIVRDYYAARALLGDSPAPRATETGGLRRRPGEQALPTASAAVSARLNAEQAVREVFTRRVCDTCHTVQAVADTETPFRIAPVFLQEHALDGARFDHAAHRGETCQSCHAAPASKHSEDVLLPDIKRCRDCHGERGADSKVPSTCLSCHGFHIAVAEQQP